MKPKIKVLIADDHAIVRMGLAALMEFEKDIEIIGQADDGNEAVAQALKLQPDVVIMDLMMPAKDGVSATAELHEKCPAAKVILLTSFGTSDGIAHALEAGASGALLKNSAEAELIPAIRRVFAGETCISDEIRRQLKSDPPAPELTPRQMDVLSLLAHGHTSKSIAEQLHISADSVNEHITVLVQKLHASNRTEAVAIAQRKQLLKI